MVEREEIAPGENESSKDELLNFVRKLEFGSPAYLACCDYRRSSVIYDELLSLRNILGEPALSAKDRILYESKLRIQEAKNAMLDFQIDNRSAEITGYKNAIDEYATLHDNLGEDIAFEIEDENPQASDNDRLKKARRVWEGIERSIQESLESKAK